jgi:hypothetical protein
LTEEFKPEKDPLGLLKPELDSRASPKPPATIRAASPISTLFLVRLPSWFTARGRNAAELVPA